MSSFGENVRKYRKIKGMTQGELGSLVGYTHSMIGKIETNQTDIPHVMVIKIANALDVPPSILFATNVESDRIKEFLPYLEQADETTLNIIRKILNMPLNS